MIVEGILLSTHNMCFLLQRHKIVLWRTDKNYLSIKYMPYLQVYWLYLLYEQCHDRMGNLLFIAPAYSKVRYRGSTFRPFVRSFVRPSVRPQFMSRCLLCSSDSWEYETLHSNYP